jgi:hypothetical protein
LTSWKDYSDPICLFLVRRKNALPAEGIQMKFIRIVAALAVLLHSGAALSQAAAPGNYASGSIAETGGSNYFAYRMGTVAPNGLDHTMRLAIGAYHMNPAAVHAQLIQLYDSGQRKISLVLWHMPFVAHPHPDSLPDVWDHVINSRDGRLSKQHEANLRSMLRWIRYIGFDEVTLRFAPQGGAIPSTKHEPWTGGWSESQYQENLSFIISTRAIMESELAGTHIQRQYDLGMELGGIDEEPAATYAARLWADYVNRFGPTDTYGFSMIASRGRITRLISTFDRGGVRPGAYAVDVYAPPQGDAIDVALEYIHQEMVRAGEGLKPIIIQETFSNDADVANRIVATLNRWPIRIGHITQWPTPRTNTAINLTPPAEYSFYGGSTAPSGNLRALSCIRSIAAHPCESQIAWASANTTNVHVLVNGLPMSGGASGTSVANWIDGAYRFELMSEHGLLDSVDITALPVGTPSLDYVDANLACSDFQCVTVRGRNILPGCFISMFSPDWSTFLGIQEHNVVCDGDSATFEVPASVRAAYSGLNFNVNNANGAWSEPVYVSIAPPKPQIYKAGLGCDQGQCIWAHTVNVSHTCSVSLFSGDWSVSLGIVQAVSCRHDGIAFEIPSHVRSTQQSINFNINNSGGTWSEPYFLEIR